MVRLKYGSNATDTVTGVIIYPDDFSFSEAGVASMAFGARPVTQINAADWATLEEAGCIFLPGASFRTYGSNVPAFGNETNPAFYSSYWSSSANNASTANIPSFFFLNPRRLATSNNDQRYIGYPVRLAQDLK